MKLSSLFAKYLYLKKELNLPGIGVFSLDPSVIIPDAAEKNATDFIQEIKYVQKPITAADEEFINFIRTETGKIRPLAESDLDSFLTDGKILLNIGKPFQLEGIGSLLKTKSGVYEFTPGEPVHSKENFYKENFEPPVKKKQPYGEDRVKSVPMRSALIIGGLIGGLILIIGGGYFLYNKKSNTAPISNVAGDSTGTTPTKANTILDSVKNIIDSTAKRVSSATSSGSTYKFIIERTTNKLRAEKRFAQIKATQTDIKMESRDSTLFSLYFVLPAQPKDTVRIKDSLRNWYGRKNIYIE